MILVSKTTVDLTTLFGVIQQYVGSVEKKTNENNVNTYLKSLNNPKNGNTNINDLTRHCYYTFLVAIHDHVIFDIFESLDLELIIINKVITPKLCLISGSLADWQTSIVKGCNLQAKPELNGLLASAFSVLKNTENLGYLWSDYKTTSDKQQLRFIEHV